MIHLYINVYSNYSLLDFTILPNICISNLL